ncbi:MAG: hypothetical protein ACPF91_06260, partial [Flavobacteriales bacterium]
NREWLLLRNDSDAPIDLLGYSLSDAVTWTQSFPLVLGPGEQAWVVRDASFFSNVPDAVVQWESGQLANEGERILLHNSAGMVVDYVQYEPAAPWPIPVAEQEALVRVSAGLDNHFASSWQLETLIETPEVVNLTGALLVYPNPVSDRITLSGIEVDDAGKALVLWGIGGQMMKEIAVSPANAMQGRVTVDVQGLASGVYALTLGERSTRFIVQ